MTPLPASVFPDFVPNQILTDTQLNALRDHLDRQDRRARLRLAGTGIVCGLGWQLDTSGTSCTITVEPGFGLTSSGHLLEVLDQVMLTRRRPYFPPPLEAGVDDTVHAESGERSPAIELHELLPEGGEELTADFCSGAVLVLWMESRPVDLRSCLVTDCNNKGLNVETRVRILLAKGDPEALRPYRIPPCPAPPETLRLPRFSARLHLGAVREAGAIGLVWGELIRTWAQHVDRVISESFERFGDSQGLDGGELQRLLDWVEELRDLAADSGQAPQEHYEALRHLVDGHREWARAACELAACPPEQGFDCHLMLGHIDGKSGYRHLHVASPLRDTEHGHGESARRLFRRLVAMADAFDDTVGSDLDLQEAVRLVPSHGEDRPVGERAVPRYFPYERDDEKTRIEQYWQPAGCCTVETLWSYHDEARPRRSQIDFDYASAGLIRIEGHRGRPCDEVEAHLRRQRADRNLDFDLIVADFETDDGDEEEQELSVQIAERLAELRRRLIEVRREAFEVMTASDDNDEWIVTQWRQVSVERRDLESAINRLAWLRSQRRACCGQAALQASYAAARSELYHELLRLRGEIAKLTVFESIPTVDEHPALVELRHGLFHGTTTMLASAVFVVPLGDGIKEVLRERWTLVAQEEGTLSALLHIGTLHLLVSIDNLLRQETLPGDVRSFIWPHFSHYYSLFTTEALALGLLLRNVLEQLDSATRRSLVAHDPAGHLDQRLLAATGSTISDRLGALAATWQAAEKCDDGRRRFLALARSRPGLEHLGGVPKGGTFVLVCDEDERVVADFALHSRLGCDCCDHSSPEPCLPLRAQVDHAIVVLSHEGRGVYAPVEASIDLLWNDGDANQNHRREGLEVELPSNISHLGAELNLEGSRVIYFLDKPMPGEIDRFTYRLKQGARRCPAETVGEVVVLLAPGVEPLPGEIRGTITRSGDPVGGAAVRLLEDGSEKRTDVQGRYAFPDRAPGRYTVMALDLLRSGELLSGGELVFDFTIGDAPPPGKIVGFVASHFGPLKGATVTIADLDLTASTNAEGGFIFPSVAAGTHTVEASLAGFGSASKTVTVNPGLTIQVNLVIEIVVQRPGIQIRVVDDATGRPISGALVELESRSIEAETDSQGVVVFTDLEPGELRVKASAFGFKESTTSFQLSGEGPREEHVIRLQARRLGRVEIDAELQPFNPDFHFGEFLPSEAEPTVSVYSADGRELLRKEARDKVRLDLDAGDYVVWANAPGYDAQSRKVTLGADETQTLEFTLLVTEWTPEVERFVEWIARRQDLEPAEAQREALVIMGRRREAQLRFLQHLTERVTRRSLPTSARAAAKFFEVLAKPVLEEAEMIEAYESAGASLRAAVPRASEENRTDYWSMLTLCDYGLLDRLTIQNPETLSEHLKEMIVAMAANTTGLIPKIDADRTRQKQRAAKYVQAWKAKELSEGLGLESPAEIEELLSKGLPS